MLIGVLYALTAGLMWGLIFVGPLIVPEYPASLQSVGRYLAFGLIALPLAWHDRHRLRQLIHTDWLEALKLTVVGNFIYYLCLASAIQRTGEHDDYWYSAGGDFGECQSEIQPPRWEAFMATPCTVATANRFRSGLRQRGRTTERTRANRYVPLCHWFSFSFHRGSVLDMVSHAQRQLVKNTPRQKPDNLGHRTGAGHPTAGSYWLCAGMGAFDHNRK